MIDNQNKNSLFKSELLIFASVFMLGLWGILTIYSSQSFSSQPLNFVSKQMLFLVIGMVIMFITKSIKFEFYIKNILVISIILWIVMVLIPFFGVKINNMAGWVNILGVRMQPSEIAKGIFLLLLSYFIVKYKGNLKFLYCVIIGALWIIPITLQPDMGSAIIYFSALCLIIILGNAPWKMIISAITVMSIGTLVFTYLHPYALKRILSFLNLHETWHITQMQMSIARGGLVGSKIGNAAWSNYYLPLPYNDSAMSTMIETLGVVGIIPLVLFFLGIIIPLINIANSKPQNSIEHLFLKCSAYLIATQALIHAAVNVAIIPTTGLTMPFISYGGSSFVAGALMLGVALSAANSNNN